MTEQEQFRRLPSVEELAREIRGEWPRTLIVAEARAALAKARSGIQQGESCAYDELASAVESAVARLLTPSLRPVINATGVVLHTNLGRAPLPGGGQGAGGYSNLEFDLTTGRRGKRDAHTAALLERLLGVPGIVVNNNAAAIFLALHELAAGHEVIVSRGELVEIGDGFRIPDIMQRSGAVLREVGTTNRTRIEDYRAVINDRTRLILRVHPSNFRIAGFTAKPSVAELAALGRASGVAVYEDIGSGCVTDLRALGIDEPVVQESLRAGVDLVSFSGDKLLGGPQAGVLAGRPDLVQRLRRNPLFRAFRVDKLVIQALESVLREWVTNDGAALPALQMIRASANEVRQRAEALVEKARAGEVIPGDSVIGGGSTPAQVLPTFVIALPETWERRLREGEPPVIGRVEKGRLLLDLRTVAADEEPALLAALQALS